MLNQIFAPSFLPKHAIHYLKNLQLKDDHDTHFIYETVIRYETPIVFVHSSNHFEMHFHNFWELFCFCLHSDETLKLQKETDNRKETKLCTYSFKKIQSSLLYRTKYSIKMPPRNKYFFKIHISALSVLQHINLISNLSIFSTTTFPPASVTGWMCMKTVIVSPPQMRYLCANAML